MLDHLDPRTVDLGGKDARLYLGDGPLALEVAVVSFDSRPTLTELRELFTERLRATLEHYRRWAGRKP